MTWVSGTHSPSITAVLYSLGPSMHVYAWRVYGKGSKPYWYHNTAYSMERYFVCLHLPNRLNYIKGAFVGLATAQWSAVLHFQNIL